MSEPVQVAKVILTAKEASDLLMFLNIGVKTIGLECAQSALHLSQKINLAFQPKQEEPKPAQAVERQG